MTFYNERVTAVEVIKTFTMDKDFTGEYAQVSIELTEDCVYRMVCDYTYVSSEEEIEYGLLQVLDTDTTPFERVESMEVSIVNN